MLTKTARRGRLSPLERQQIAYSSLPTSELARCFDVTPDTIRAHRRQRPGGEQGAASAFAARVGFSAPDPAVRSLIEAYEAGKKARGQWGDAAACHYKDEHAQAWHVGYEAAATRAWATFSQCNKTFAVRSPLQPRGVGGMQSR